MRLLSGGLLLVGFLIVTITGYFYTSAASDDQSIAADEYRFVKSSCWFNADWKAAITCGVLHTPESSGVFRLPVVILHDESAGRRNDPVVYLQGGPGAGAKLHDDGIKSWLSWMRYAGLKRDIILIDTRGTGRSSPALVCANYNKNNQQLLRENIPLSVELAQNFDVTMQCFDEAVQKNTALDYRNFSTQQSAKDVRALMALLNYSEWNILGVSYGTRLALEIERQEKLTPQAVRLKSMVLDSIYPAGFGGVQTWPQVLDEAMRQFFEGCSARQECMAALQNKHLSLEQQFMQAMQYFREAPVSLTIKRWDGEVPVNFLVNDHRFLSAAFSAIYDPQDWPKIIAGINAAHGGQAALLKPLIEPFVNHSMTSDFNSLTFTAVDCADNPVMAEQDYEKALAQYPRFSEYTRDQWRYQLCHRLPSAQPLQRVAPALPTLILSGALDPITPLSWARQVHSEWPNSQLSVSVSAAHSVLGSEVCLLQELVKFFDGPQQEFDVCEGVGDN